MKKRLRKKLHRREFTQFVFGIGLQFSAVDENERESFLDSFIDFVESLNLGFGGVGSDNQWDGVVQGDGISVTEDQRKKIIQWLIENDQVTAYFVTPLLDGWNGVDIDLDPKSVEYTQKSK